MKRPATDSDGGSLPERPPVRVLQPGVTLEAEFAPGDDSQERCTRALLAVLRAPRKEGESR